MTSIIKIDELLKKWSVNRENLKKILTGKQKFLPFNLLSKLEQYPNNEVCHKKFNFAIPSNKCIECTELSLLSKSGDFTHEDLEINSKNNKNLKIRAGKYQTELSTISYDNIDLNFAYSNLKHKKIFSDLKAKTKILIIEDGDFESREIVMSVCLEWLSIVNVNFFWFYKCDNVVMIRKIVEPQIDVDMNENKLLSILYFILTLSDKNFVHGEESLLFMGIVNCKKYKLEINGKTIKHDITVHIKTSDKSSLLIEGYGSNVFIPSKTFNKNSNATIPISIKLTRKTHSNDYFDFPMLQEYKIHIIPIIKMTPEIFEYRENICLNVFKPLTVYLWFIALLCNTIFYNLISIELLNVFFFENELEHIISSVREKHSQLDVSYDEIKQLCINLNFSMKIDLLEKLREYIEAKL